MTERINRIGVNRAVRREGGDIGGKDGKWWKFYVCISFMNPFFHITLFGVDVNFAHFAAFWVILSEDNLATAE